MFFFYYNLTFIGAERSSVVVNQEGAKLGLNYIFEARPKLGS